MMTFMIAMIIVGLIVTGTISSALVFGFIFLVIAGCLVAFTSIFFSWPVILIAVVLWLLLREKPIKNRRMRY